VERSGDGDWNGDWDGDWDGDVNGVWKWNESANGGGQKSLGRDRRNSWTRVDVWRKLALAG
jgi:hypothetical protein